MTTLPANVSPNLHNAARSSAPAPQAAPTPVALDPLKLINKYKWLLLGAAVIGAGLGVAAHLTLRSLVPQWRPVVLFKVLPPQETLAGGGTAMLSPNEMDRFMQTELRTMTSEMVLNRVAEDPQLQKKAPGWAAQFQQMTTDEKTGIPKERFDSISAAKKLEDIVGARVLPQTNLIELSVTGRNPQDATEILALVREKYTILLGDQTKLRTDESIKTYRETVKRLEDEINALVTQRTTLIDTSKLDTLDDKVATERARLTNTNEELLKIQQSLQSSQKQLDQFIEVANSGTYSPDLRAQVEKDPGVMEVQSTISRLETSRQMLINEGKGPDHREVRAVDAQLHGSKQNLERVQNEKLEKMLSGGIDSLNKSIAQQQAAEKKMLDDKKDMQTRLLDLTQAQSRLTDIDRELESRQANKSKFNGELQDLLGRRGLPSYSRVVLLQPERTPTEISFPKIKMMVPMGVFACVGLLSGLLLLREVVDQRVKGPSDIAIIPRMRLLGWVPDAVEDPAGQGATETAFRDRSRGIVAEAYRQIRGNMAKRLHQSDHRTVLVTAGMPGSGATTAVANLAFAYASAEKRVLVVDANFRRPAMHRVMGLQEGPGLADVLARSTELPAAIQATSTPGLDLLSAGTRDLRVYERLATESMSALLTKVRGMYDIVLIDCAPAAVAGDAIAIAHRCDASILIVRAMAEKRGLIARLRNELSEGRSDFLGVIVNTVKSSSGGYMRKNIRASHEYHKQA